MLTSVCAAPVLSLLALLVLSSVVLAYNFQDTHFNEILADHLEDLDLDFSFRVRRDVSVDSEDEAEKFLKCKHHHGKSCCGKGKWMKHFPPGIADATKKAYGDCFEDFQQKLNATGVAAGGDPFSCERVNQMKMKAICTADCIAHKGEMINEDGTINKDKVLSHMEKIEYEDWQKPIIVNAISKCATTANSTKVSTPSTGDIECSMAMISFQHCIFVESEKPKASEQILQYAQHECNCPEDQKKTEGKCKKVFDKYKATVV